MSVPCQGCGHPLWIGGDIGFTASFPDNETMCIVCAVLGPPATRNHSLAEGITI